MRLDCRDQGGAIDAEPCEFLGGKLDDDLLILGAENLDLGDVRYPQEPRADFLDIIAKLAMGETIRGEAVDDPERVAELVVEAGADDAGRQGTADVADVLADMIPDVRHFLGRGAAFQVHEYGGDAGAREAAQKVEVRRLFEGAFDAIGHLIERVIEGRARPRRLNDHGSESERRVFVAAEPHIRHHAHDDRDQHQINHEGAVIERPFG